MTIVGESPGIAVLCPFPKKNNSGDDGKGAMVSWTMRPKYVFAALHVHAAGSKERQRPP